MINNRSVIKNICILMLFIILTCFFFYPVVFDMNNKIPFFKSTDESYAVIWDSWRIKQAFIEHAPFNSTNLIAAPFGIDRAYTSVTNPLFILVFFVLSILCNHICVYNIISIANFVLAGFFAYLLIFYLTKNNFSAVFGGIIFSFSPYHFTRVWQHLGSSYIQWMPLYMLALLKLKENPTMKNSVLAGVALWLVGAFNYYDYYFMIISTCLFILFIFIHTEDKNSKEFKLKNSLKVKLGTIIKVISCVVISIALTSPAIISVVRNRFFTHSITESSLLFHRPFEHLFTQSARPLSYLLPSTEHPLFGNFTEIFVGDYLWGQSYTEHQLYLGWTAIILSFFAFSRWRRRKRLVVTNKLGSKEEFAIGFFAFLAIGAWFFSQSPWWTIGKYRIFMPSYFMYKIVPMFRAYSRFGVVVLLSIATLAGWGLKFILENRKGKIGQYLITGIFCGLILFEFYNDPNTHYEDLSKYPKVYDWLKQQPGDIIIAEYPLDIKGPSTGPRELYKFYQTKHEKKMINSTSPGTYAYKISQSIVKLSEPRTAGVLKWLGVKYVLVHKEIYKESELVEAREDFRRIKRNRGLKSVRNFGDIDVYEIIAESKKSDIHK